jgi:hypothetical protein
MPRKKAVPAEPKTPWIEITPMPLKLVRDYTSCFVCEREFPKPRHNIVYVSAERSRPC